MSECDWDSEEAEEVPLGSRIGHGQVLEDSEDSESDLEGWELTETAEDDEDEFNIFAYVCAASDNKSSRSQLDCPDTRVC